MALTYDQTQTIRSWVGQDVSQTTLEKKYARLGDVDAVILEVLNDLLVEAIASPTTISLPGLSLTFQDAVRGIQDLIDRFIGQGGTDGFPDTAGVSVKRFVRTDYR